MIDRRKLTLLIVILIFSSGNRPRWDAPSALLTLRQDIGEAIVVVDASGKTFEITGPKQIGDVQMSPAGYVVSYLAVEGINPSHNFIETVDLQDGSVRRVHPEDGFAIFGFALTRGGDRLAYLEVSMRSGGWQIPWHVLLLDVATGKREIVLESDGEVRGTPAQQPIAWSPTSDEIYSRALIPYSGGGACGIWAMKPDGSNLRLILPEEQYVGLPQISPDGTWLACLASDPHRLLGDYQSDSGAPPANILKVMNLKTGEESIIARQEQNGAYDRLSWTPDGTEILLSKGEWRDGSFHYREIISVGRDASYRHEVVALTKGMIGDFQSCGRDTLLYTIRRAEGTELMLLRDDDTPLSLLSLPGGDIEIIASLEERK